MINLKDSFKTFLDYANSKSPCGEGVAWMTSQDCEKITLQEAIDGFLADSGASEGWAHWVVLNMAEELSEEALLLFIEKIEDPMLARRLQKDNTHLTEKHISRLREKWVGKIGDNE